MNTGVSAGPSTGAAVADPATAPALATLTTEAPPPGPLLHLDARERLLLAQAVAESGREPPDWADVSQLLLKHPMLKEGEGRLGRPALAEVFSQRSCQRAWTALMRQRGLTRPQDAASSDKGKEASPRSDKKAQLALSQLLYVERIEELATLLAAREKKYRELETELELLQSSEGAAKVLDPTAAKVQAQEALESKTEDASATAFPPKSARERRASARGEAVAKLSALSTTEDKPAKVDEEPSTEPVSTATDANGTKGAAAMEEEKTEAAAPAKAAKGSPKKRGPKGEGTADAEEGGEDSPLSEEGEAAEEDGDETEEEEHPQRRAQPAARGRRRGASFRGRKAQDQQEAEDAEESKDEEAAVADEDEEEEDAEEGKEVKPRTTRGKRNREVAELDETPTLTRRGSTTTDGPTTPREKRLRGRGAPAADEEPSTATRATRASATPATVGAQGTGRGGKTRRSSRRGAAAQADDDEASTRDVSAAGSVEPEDHADGASTAASKDVEEEGEGGEEQEDEDGDEEGEEEEEGASGATKRGGRGRAVRTRRSTRKK